MHRSIFLSLLVCGCATHVIDDNRVAERIYLSDVTCYEPVVLTRDCSDNRGPSRRAKIGDHSFRFAGNEDGTVVLIVLSTGDDMKTDLLEIGSLSILDPGGEKLEEIYTVVESALTDAGMSVLKITPVIVTEWFIRRRNSGRTFGYFLEVGGDGYTEL